MKEITGILPNVATQNSNVRFQGYKHKAQPRDWAEPKSMRLGRSVKIVSSGDG